MKKTLALILAACMSFSLVACNGGDKSNTPGGSQSGSNPGTSSQQPGLRQPDHYRRRRGRQDRGYRHAHPVSGAVEPGRRLP